MVPRLIRPWILFQGLFLLGKGEIFMAVDLKNIVLEAKEAFTRCQNQNELLQEIANFLGKKKHIK